MKWENFLKESTKLSQEETDNLNSRCFKNGICNLSLPNIFRYFTVIGSLVLLRSGNILYVANCLKLKIYFMVLCTSSCVLEKTVFRSSGVL